MPSLEEMLKCLNCIGFYDCRQGGVLMFNNNFLEYSKLIDDYSEIQTGAVFLT